MKRIKDLSGIIHFRGKSDFIALCGTVQSANLLGQTDQMDSTSSRVTCPICATLYCQIKNAPWNEVDEKTMDDAIYSAAKEDDDAGATIQ